MGEYKDKPDLLIINSPYEEPKEHWHFDSKSQKFKRMKERRSAGYFVPSQCHKQHNSPGEFVEIPLVNKIRSRLKKWRDEKYPGTTGVTRNLLQFWRNGKNKIRHYPFFFCQLEAIETLIWLKEAHESEKEGIDIKQDGGFERLCCKMATGTGKTFVMAMVIAWQVLNKVKYPKDLRFSKNILLISPNLTVKKRLSVLDWTNEKKNYYSEYKIIADSERPFLMQGNIVINNWHQLMWESEENLSRKKSVDKRGEKSDEAYIRDILRDMSRCKNILVLNDEAHHAWRIPAELKRKKVPNISREDKEKATKWVSGLDRIHKARGILSCFDFSATPFAPSGGQSKRENLFGWIVSDFGLTDAIESGLTKTPRHVVRDDGPIDPKTLKSQLYHIYEAEGVKENLKKKSVPEASLPDLVLNAYALLGLDWRETLRNWKKRDDIHTPPVLISIVNRKETADRIKYAFDKEKVQVDSKLSDPSKTLLIYSDLDNSHSKGNQLGLVDKEKYREFLEKENLKDIQDNKKRFLSELVNTVGSFKDIGGDIQHVISVMMLSEGWSCNTVTHIMGLRAFSSQLLCEQIIGRGLRRTSYEINEKGMFDPEYVNVFGIPFSFLPQESYEGDVKVQLPGISIYPDPAKKQYKINWPNVERIEYHLQPELEINLDSIEPLKIDVRKILQKADLSIPITGNFDQQRIKTIDLEKLIKQKHIRYQSLLMGILVGVYEELDISWKKKIDKQYALSQLYFILEKFLKTEKVSITPDSTNSDEEKRNLTIMLSMSKIVDYLVRKITYQNRENVIPIFRKPKMKSTEDAPLWYTRKDTFVFHKTHMNLCVFDSHWEHAHARELDRNNEVEAWVKNDHWGFEISYSYKGSSHNYRPDFIVKLKQGDFIVFEVKGDFKGREKEKDSAKWENMDMLIKAINKSHKETKWHFYISKDESGNEVHDVVAKVLNLKKSS